MSEKSKEPIVKVQCNECGRWIPRDEFPEEGLFVCSKCLGRNVETLDTEKEPERFLKWIRDDGGENYRFTIKVWTSKKYLNYPFNPDVFNLMLTNFVVQFLDYERTIKEYYDIKLDNAQKNKIQRFCNIKLNNMVKEIFAFLKRQWKMNIGEKK